MIPVRLITLLPFLFMTPAVADDWTTTKSNNDVNPRATKIVDYYEAPPRVALTTLADRWRYAASGTLTCQGLKGTKYAGKEIESSAQLTSNHNLITTAGHTFNEFTGTGVCEQHADPSSCVFSIKTHGVTRSVRAELVESGITCPDKTGAERDWSVMRLPCEVDDVEPYSIDPNRIDNLNLNDAVATVAQSIDFQGHPDHHNGPLHFSQCSVLKTYGGTPAASVSTACGCSAGCSGGALLSPVPNVTLLGVMVQTNEKDFQPSTRPNVVHWQVDGNGSYFVLITREFRDALTRQAVQKVKLKSCFSGSD